MNYDNQSFKDQTVELSGNLVSWLYVREMQIGLSR